MTAFLDSRNPAELLLAPRFVASLSVVNFSSLKLNIGGTTPLPGVISSPAQIAGPITTQLGASIANKAAVATLSVNISSVLSDFSAQAAAATNGTYVAPDSLLVPTANGIPNVASFLSFSILAPGAPIPANFTAIIAARQVQLQSLSKAFSSVSATTNFGGVTVTENLNPTTNPQPYQVDIPSAPRLAQGGAVAQADPILQNKLAFTVHGVNIGTGKPNSWSRLLNIVTNPPLNLNAVVGQLFNDRQNQSTWHEPPTPYNATFPYNRVTQTTGGHLLEFDDTPGAERVHIYHRAGSFIEFHPDGSVVYKNMNDGYEICMADKNVKVNGQCNIAVDGNITIYSKGNIDVQADGDVNYQVKGNFNVFAENIAMRSKTQFLADGTDINLRYIDLPLSIIPVFAGVSFVGMAPSVNMTEVTADTGISVPSISFTPTMSPSGGVPVSTPTITPPTIPPENPLSNFSVYTSMVPAAIDYRAHLFDTPEQVNDFQLYTAHTGLELSLSDTTGNERQLAGSLTTMNTGLVAPTLKPPVNYLNYDDYKGNYIYANNYAVGNTSFLLSQLADISLYPSFIMDTTLTPFIEGITPDMGASTGGGSFPGSTPGMSAEGTAVASFAVSSGAEGATPPPDTFIPEGG